MSSRESTASHKANLRDYFDGVGFDRWKAIYGNDDNLSYIRRTVQQGHEQMLSHAGAWLMDSCPSGSTVLDAGCGTGLFSLAMAQQGYCVTAVDISPNMVQHAEQSATTLALDDKIVFRASDIESINDTFDAIACFDVLVHYPNELFVPLCSKLAQQAKQTLLITYAPYNRFLAALHWVGGRFPQGQRRTEIQMIRDETVQQAIAGAGMTIRRTATVSHGFYHVKLLQAVR